MKSSIIPLTVLAISVTTLASALADGPRLMQPGTLYTPAPPAYESTPIPQSSTPAPPTTTERMPTPAPREEDGRMYLPEPKTEQPLVPYVESPRRGAPPGPPLYDKVRYKDQRRKHPHAVPYLVEVPLWKPILPRRRAKYCGPECAYITICVPPCKEPCVKVRRFGHKLCYDFGKYKVNVVVRRNNRIIVDYDS